MASDADGNMSIVKINFGNGFSTDGNHTPNNEIASYAVEGYVEGIKNAVNNGTCLESVTVSATTNAHHGDAGPPNWDVSSSNHYVKNGGDGIDTNLINGKIANNSNIASSGLQTGMSKVSNILENKGPVINTDNSHKTHIHNAFKPKN